MLVDKRDRERVIGGAPYSSELIDKLVEHGYRITTLGHSNGLAERTQLACVAVDDEPLIIFNLTPTINELNLAMGIANTSVFAEWVETLGLKGDICCCIKPPSSYRLSETMPALASMHRDTRLFFCAQVDAEAHRDAFAEELELMALCNRYSGPPVRLEREHLEVLALEVADESEYYEMNDNMDSIQDGELYRFIASDGCCEEEV